MRRLLVGLLALPLALAAQDGVAATDPAPERTLITTTARALPAGAATFTLMPVLASGIWSVGVSERVTLTVGGPLWTLLFLHVAGAWNVKVQLLDQGGLALAVGDFGLGLAELRAAGSDSWLVHWPYWAATAGPPELRVTLVAGYGLGEATLGEPLGRRIATQLSLASRLGSRATFFLEATGMYGGYVLGLAGVRVWDGRYFLDMGAAFSSGVATPFPWVSVGGRL